MHSFDQVLVKTRKGEDQDKSILLQGDWPELQYEVDFHTNSFSKQNQRF